MFYSSQYAADLYISTRPVQPPTQDSSLVSCYPHGFDCLSVIVPRSQQHNPFFVQIMANKFTWTVLLTLGAFVLFRILITGEPFALGVILTIGMFLAQHYQTIKMKPSKHLWSICMLVFGFFATTILSSMLFASLVDNRVIGEIDSLDDLAASGLTVYVNDPSHEDFWDFSKLFT